MSIFTDGAVDGFQLSFVANDIGHVCVDLSGCGVTFCLQTMIDAVVHMVEPPENART